MLLILPGASLVLHGRSRSCSQQNDRGLKTAMDLKLKISKTEDIAVIDCEGRIVFGGEADELRRVILGLLSEDKRIILNFAAIENIDSSGVGTLVASFISARHSGAELKFAALSPAAQRVITHTNVDQIFDVYASTQDAINSFKRQIEAAAG